MGGELGRGGGRVDRDGERGGAAVRRKCVLEMQGEDLDEARGP